MTKEQRAKIVKYLEQTLRKMRGLFSNTYIQSIEEMRDAIEAGADFKWDDFKAQSQKIDKLIDSLLNKTGAMVFNGVTSTYQTAVNNSVKSIQDKYAELKKKYTRKKDIRETTAEATDVIRGGANSKVDSSVGERISSRVWNLKDDVKNTITIEIKNAIAQGLSVDQAKNWVKNYLNNPKLITMYVKDKDGNLVMSEEAKNLHPGRGVYRDPLKNAERLLRTEMMAAYRQAEIEQYQKTDLVIGYEIKLSGNHTTTDGKGGIKKLKDICDKLQGRYPKTFIWHGWHPNCRCVLLPLYVSDDKMESYFDAKHNGTLDDWNKKNQISVLPKNFNEWVQDNSQRLNLAQNAKKTALPQWVEDNEDFDIISNNIEGLSTHNEIESKDSFFERIIEKIGIEQTSIHNNLGNSTKEFISNLDDKISSKDVRSFIHVYVNENPKLFGGNFKSVVTSDSVGGFMSVKPYNNDSKLDRLSISSADINGFNPLNELKRALLAIRDNKPLDFKAESAIECLNHEFIHSTSKGYRVYPKKNEEDIFVINVFETITEFVSRRNYDKFLAKIGGKATKIETIKKSGIVYTEQQKSFMDILLEAGIDEKELIGDFETMLSETYYEDMFDKLILILQKKSKKSLNVDSLLDLFMCQK